MNNPFAELMSLALTKKLGFNQQTGASSNPIEDEVKALFKGNYVHNIECWQKGDFTMVEVRGALPKSCNGFACIGFSKRNRTDKQDNALGIKLAATRALIDFYKKVEIELARS